MKPKFNNDFVNPLVGLRLRVGCKIKIAAVELDPSGGVNRFDSFVFPAAVALLLAK
jgi:hypothetical protein